MTVMAIGHIDELGLGLLRAFNALLETRNVTRAAERLSVTQPTMSKSLARLRAILGDPLFVRRAQGIVPTPRALELALPVARAMHALEALAGAEPFQPDGELTITVAATDYGLSVVLAPVIAELARRAPQVRVRVVPLHRLSLEEELASGAVDFALGGQDRAPGALIGRRLFDDPFLGAMRADHPARDQAMSLDLFCELPHVLVATGGGAPFSGRTDAVLAELGRSRRVVASVTGFLALPDIVRASDLVAIAPERLLQRYSTGLHLFEPPVRVPALPLTLLWHERTQASRSHQWLRELIVELVGSNSSGHSHQIGTKI